VVELGLLIRAMASGHVRKERGGEAARDSGLCLHAQSAVLGSFADWGLGFASSGAQLAGGLAVVMLRCYMCRVIWEEEAFFAKDLSEI